MKVSLSQQIEEIDRELALRDGVYKRAVSAGKMRQSIADFHMGRMTAARDTLIWLRANEDKIKAALASEAA